MFLNYKNRFRFFVEVGNERSYLALFGFLVLSRARVHFCCSPLIIWHSLNVCDVALVLCASSFVQQSLLPDRGPMVSGSTQSGFRSHRRTAGHIMRLHGIFSKSLAYKHRVLAVFIDLSKAH